MSKTPDTWSMDAIQFPRVLVAINDVDLTQQQVEHLCEAMDLEPHHLDEIFIRAQERWKAIEATGSDTQPYSRRWKCPGCGRTVDCSYESLAEVGSPFCADCEQEMTLL